MDKEGISSSDRIYTRDRRDKKDIVLDKLMETYLVKSA